MHLVTRGCSQRRSHPWLSSSAAIAAPCRRRRRRNCRMQRAPVPLLCAWMSALQRQALGMLDCGSTIMERACSMSSSSAACRRTISSLRRAYLRSWQPPFSSVLFLKRATSSGARQRRHPGPIVPLQCGSRRGISGHLNHASPCGSTRALAARTFTSASARNRRGG